MPRVLLTSLLIVLLKCSFITESINDDFTPPPLTPLLSSDTNVVRIRVNSNIKEKLFSSSPSNEKYFCSFDTPLKSFNNCKLDLHGNGTLYAKRKNFDLKFQECDSLPLNNIHCKRVRLLSLSSDKGYINNLLGYSICSSLNLFFSKFQLVELYVNESSQGLYLLIEDVEESIKRTFSNIEFIIRRRNNDDIDLKYYKSKNIQKCLSASDYLNKYKAIYSYAQLYMGENLLHSLKEQINLNNYYKWLSINTLLKNGDYSDELYVYGYPDTSTFKPYFDFAVWDFDDLFSLPHDNNSNANSLIYCNENSLDRDIANDPVLYSNFKDVLSFLLENNLNKGYMDSLFESITPKLKFYLTNSKFLDIDNNLSSEKICTWNDYISYYDSLKTVILERKTFLQKELQ